MQNMDGVVQKLCKYAMGSCYIYTLTHHDNINFMNNNRISNNPITQSSFPPWCPVVTK